MPSTKSFEVGLELIKKDPSKILGLTVGKHNITEPGQYVPRADGQSSPQLTYAAASPGKSYVVIGLDLDAPFRSFAKLGPILHWLQTGLKPTTAPGGALETGSPDEPTIANYIGPAPPPLAAPHRYVFYLYEAPASLSRDEAKKLAPADGKSLPATSRMWANLDAWEEKLGLKGGLVAANYFTSN